MDGLSLLPLAKMMGNGMPCIGIIRTTTNILRVFPRGSSVKVIQVDRELRDWGFTALQSCDDLGETTNLVQQKPDLATSLLAD